MPGLWPVDEAGYNVVNRGGFSWNRALGVVKQRQSVFRAIPPRALVLLALVMVLFVGLQGCGCPTQEEIDSIAVTLTTVSDASATAVVGATTTVPVETTTTATTEATTSTTRTTQAPATTTTKVQATTSTTRTTDAPTTTIRTTTTLANRTTTTIAKK